ncbi:MAG: hypothetical protein HRT57_12930 [Crocinitomicaceae bacterium]|nr:hypothetical protein [Crocinitomicaceae bacterium]
MKTYSILFIFMLCLGHSIFSQVRKKVPVMENEIDPIERTALDDSECSEFYKYGFRNTRMVNLETLTEIDTVLSTNYRLCSKYAHRFTSNWNDTVFVGHDMFVIVDDEDTETYELHIEKFKQENQIIQLPVENPLPEVREYSFHLLPYKNSVILMMSNNYSTHFKMVKYSTTGNVLMSREIEHTSVTHPEPNTDYHHPSLNYNRLTNSQIIFTSHPTFADTMKTVLLNMDNFSLKYHDKTSRGIILDRSERELIGFVSVNGEYEKYLNHFEVEMTNGTHYNFTLRYGMPECSFLLHDSLLYIANYHPISTGAGLHCLDLRTNKLIWSADVIQVNADHSKYSNHVSLSLYKNKLLMEGTEMNGEYLQVFDFKSGERLSAFGITDISGLFKD